MAKYDYGEAVSFGAVAGVSARKSWPFLWVVFLKGSGFLVRTKLKIAGGVGVGSSGGVVGGCLQE